MRDAVVVRAAEAILGLVERSLLLVSVALGEGALELAVGALVQFALLVERDILLVDLALFESAPELAVGALVELEDLVFLLVREALLHSAAEAVFALVETEERLLSCLRAFLNMTRRID